MIPTRDRPGPLGRLVAALAADADGLELVVVDDGSRARGPVAAAAGEARLLRTPGLGPAAARNLGARSAGGEVVCFIDDDCEPAPGWARTLAGAAGESGVGRGAHAGAARCRSAGRRLAGDRRAPDAGIPGPGHRPPRLRPQLQPGRLPRGARAAALRRVVSERRRRGPRLERPCRRGRARGRLRPRGRGRPPPAPRTGRVRPPAVPLRPRSGAVSGPRRRPPGGAGVVLRGPRAARVRGRAGGRGAGFGGAGADRGGSGGREGRVRERRLRVTAVNSGVPAMPSLSAPVTSQTVAATSTSRARTLWFGVLGGARGDDRPGVAGRVVARATRAGAETAHLAERLGVQRGERGRGRPRPAHARSGSRSAWLPG